VSGRSRRSSEAEHATSETGDAARRGTSASRPARPPERWAALDIGSDTVHLLVAKVERGPFGRLAVRQVAHRSSLVELGREVALHGRFRRTSIRELEAAVGRYVEIARRGDARLIVAATEASREAANGSEVLARLERLTGTPARILSGGREAQLGFLAARAVLPPKGVDLLVDSGGASTEVSVVADRRLVASASLAVGAASLAAVVPGDPPKPLPWALAAVRIGTVVEAAPIARPSSRWLHSHQKIVLNSERLMPALSSRYCGMVL